MDTVPTVTIDELNRAIDSGDQSIALIDVRTAEEFADVNIRGAENIPLNELISNLHKVVTDHQGKKIYVICKAGVRSEKAAAALIGAGASAFNVVEGMDGWLKDIPFDL